MKPIPLPASRSAATASTAPSRASSPSHTQPSRSSSRLSYGATAGESGTRPLSSPRMRLPLILVITCLLLGGIAGCGGDDKPGAGDGSGTTAESTSTPEDTGEATPTPEDTGGEQEGCPAAEQPPPKEIKVPKPDEQLDPAKTYVATVKTSCGTFEITLDAKRAPKT